MDSQKQRAIESCKKVLDLLIDISKTRDLSTGELNALENDRVAIQTLLGMITEVNSSEQYRGAWNSINHLRHTFGGYIGGDKEYELSLAFEQLLHDVLDMLQ